MKSGRNRWNFRNQNTSFSQRWIGPGSSQSGWRGPKHPQNPELHCSGLVESQLSLEHKIEFWSPCCQCTAITVHGTAPKKTASCFTWLWLVLKKGKKTSNWTSLHQSRNCRNCRLNLLDNTEITVIRVALPDAQTVPGFSMICQGGCQCWEFHKLFSKENVWVFLDQPTYNF